MSERPIFNQGVGTPFLTEQHRLIETSTADANVIVESGEHVLYLQMVDYYAAAKRLAQQVIDSGGQDNVLVYPIMFLYRHYTELVLKYIIFLNNRLEQNGGEFPHGHDLTKLWQACRPILLPLWTNREGEFDRQLDIAENMISEFMRLDARGTAMRYPFIDEGTPFHTGQIKFSMEKVTEAMGALDLLLGTSVTLLRLKIEDEERSRKWTEDFFRAIDAQLMSDDEETQATNPS